MKRTDTDQVVGASGGQGPPPMDFVCGEGKVDPRIDQAVVGMAQGEVKELPWDMGPRDESKTQRVDCTYHGLPADAPVGSRVEFKGQSWIVAENNFNFECGGNTLTLDGNHPLAGLPITFTVKVESVN
eukprot:TRINITY_DN24301_c0_g1_i1.p2 TRINITY_DN24301_c0_g1~~TRINITY_DN24301_c0_g1_i1.p2  ORF type:complete len:128 (+),score=17.99 TRINITY_DN24301_c0_g1_i1:304-687(+)